MAAVNPIIATGHQILASSPIPAHALEQSRD